MRVQLFVIAVLLLAGVSFSVNLNSCTNISSSGNYTLNQSVSGNPFSYYFGSYTTCMKISASNVVLDCAGFTISGTGNSDVEIESPGNGVTVKNCVLTNGTSGVIGVDILGLHNGTITKNKINTSYAGISGVLAFGSSNNSNFTFNNITGSEFGIWEPGNFANVNNNRVLGTLDGIITGSANDSVTNNYINGSTGAGILIQYSNHTISYNVIGNSTGSFADGILAGGNPSADNCIISYNNVSSSGGNGVQLGAGSSDGNVDTCVVQNNIIKDNGGDGIHAEGLTNSMIRGNNITNSSNGISLAVGIGEGTHPTTDNAIQNNYVHSNTADGVLGSSISLCNFTSNNATSNGANGFELDTSDDNILDSNRALNNSGNGYLLSDTFSQIFFCQFCLVGSFNNLTNDIATNNSNDGFLLNTTDNNILDSDSATNNGNNGIELYNATFNNITSSNATNNPTDGIMLRTGSDNNILKNDIGSNNGAEGIAFVSSFNDSVDSSIANSNSVGFYIFTAGSDNMTNNSASNNADGWDVDYSDSDVLDGNNATNNFFPGFWLFQSTNTVLSNNIGSGNSGSDTTFAAFLIEQSNDTNMTNNIAHDNSGIGLSLKDSNTTTIDGIHYYNNLVDSQFNGTGMTVTATNSLFDNPADSLVDYTNISMSDTLDSVYTMNWSAQPAALPGNGAYLSFNNKFLNITNLSSTSIDQITWNWLPSEVVSPYIESKLTLWKYNASGWTPLNSSPDTVNHKLSLFNVNSFSVFAVLMNDSCPVPITAPGSYSLTNNVVGAPNDASEYTSGAGACVKIGASNVIFDCQGFKMSNNATLGTTFGVFINSSATNVTVENCIMDNNYTFGAGIFQSDGNMLTNNTAFNDTNGFLLQQASSNNLSENQANNNTGRGFDLRSSSNTNTLEQNNATGNGQEGFNMGSGSDNNTLENNIASFSQTQSGFAWGGISGGSSNNEIIGNTAHDNTGEGFTCVGTSSDNTITGNLAQSNTLDGFFFQTCTGNNITGNNATSNGQGGFTAQVNSDGNTFTGNLFNSNTQEGIRIVGSMNNLLDSNNATSNGQQGFLLQSGSTLNNLTNNNATGNVNGFQVSDSDNNSFMNNDAFNNTQYGYFVDPATGNNFTSNTADFNSQHGFVLYGGFGPVTQNNLISNSAHDNGQAGFDLELATDNTLDSNTAFNDNNGFVLLGSTSNRITNNIISSISQVGISMLPGSDSNNVTGNNITNSGTFGVGVSSSSSNLISLNQISGYGIEGVLLIGGSNINTVSNNTATGGQVGLAVFNDSNSNSILSNTVFNNSEGGIGVAVSADNNVTLNNVFGNGFGGPIDLSFVFGPAFTSFHFGQMATIFANNTLVSSNTVQNGSMIGMSDVDSIATIMTNNSVSGNAESGVQINGSNNTALSSNAIFSNTQDGAFLFDSNGTTLDSDHIYGNGLAMRLESAFSNPFNYNLSNVIIDNPLGSFANYTNLSANDSVDSDSSYSMNWSAAPAPLPPGTASVAGKHLNITKLFGSPVVDALSFRWQPADVALVQESSLKLWKYNGTWLAINSTPDVINHRLNNYSLDSFSVLSILSGPPPSSTGGGNQGATPNLAISVDSISCSNNTITVEGNGAPVPGASVYVDGSSLGTTDQNGQISFEGCGKTVQVSASKGGYNDGQVSLTEVDCTKCPVCSTNNDCPSDQRCDAAGMCVPVQCSCGQSVQNHTCSGDVWQCGAGPNCESCPQGQSCGDDHQCKPLGCTSDLGCKDSQVCLTQTGAPGTPSSPGACKDLCADGTNSCQCAQATNHTLVPYGYECGNESGCQQCPGSAQCIDHKCVQNDINCPTSGIVGDNKICTATQGNQSCISCDVQITDPTGKTSNGKTDGSGNFDLPLSLEGTYHIALLKNGTVIKVVDIRSLPRAQPVEQPKPTTQGPDLFSLLWLLILLLLIIGGIIWYRSRQGEKGGKK